MTIGAAINVVVVVGSSSGGGGVAEYEFHIARSPVDHHILPHLPEETRSINREV